MIPCPKGCASRDPDWCSECGARIAPPESPKAPGKPPEKAPEKAPEKPGPPCPGCATPRRASAAFCEGCGYDWRAGRPATPRAAAPCGLEVLVGVEPSSGETLPGDRVTVVPLERDEHLIGRTSLVRDIHPDIAVDHDPAVSHRHAKLIRSDGALLLVDLGSANGTRLNGHELAPGERVPIRPGDKVALGKSTVLSVRAR